MGLQEPREPQKTHAGAVTGMYPFRMANLPLALAILFLALLSGCSLFPTSLVAADSGYRILDFTLLGDTAIALRMETWQSVKPPDPDPDTAPLIKKGFALLDRKTNSIRTLTDLPISAAPTFPAWFFACDSGKPVSVHPPGITGPAGTCVDTAQPAVTNNGYRIIYADSMGTVHLFGNDLQQFEVLVTGARRVEVLNAAYGTLSASILEWFNQGDSALWRGFAIDDPSGSDSAWLVSPREVRVHADGTQLVCDDADASRGLMPCWSPPGISGFRAAFDEGAGSALRPEWDPETGVLAYLDGPSRFVLLNPATGGRVVLDAGAMLAGYRP